ncbi:hypothetical protein [Streptomyces adelaidensis]|uniref:hypothetical protein n=1 Tax=Streptomyces adelaidensis TaxID=2796465 RepID=UPI0019039097|nr:hypothetical protein [Streptomyces adelaidensis]
MAIEPAAGGRVLGASIRGRLRGGGGGQQRGERDGGGCLAADPDPAVGPAALPRIRRPARAANTQPLS